MNTKGYSFTPPSKALKWTGIIATIGMYIINFVGFLDTQTNSALAWTNQGGRFHSTIQVPLPSTNDSALKPGFSKAPCWGDRLRPPLSFD